MSGLILPGSEEFKKLSAVFTQYTQGKTGREGAKLVQTGQVPASSSPHSLFQPSAPSPRTLGAKLRAFGVDDIPKPDINSASAMEIADAIDDVPYSTLIMSSFEFAQKIVAFRKENGPFRRMEDLLLVPYLGQKKYLAIKDKLSIVAPNFIVDKAGNKNVEAKPKSNKTDRPSGKFSTKFRTFVKNPQRAQFKIPQEHIDEAKEFLDSPNLTAIDNAIKSILRSKDPYDRLGWLKENIEAFTKKYQKMTVPTIFKLACGKEWEDNIKIFERDIARYIPLGFEPAGIVKVLGSSDRDEKLKIIREDYKAKYQYLDADPSTGTKKPDGFNNKSFCRTIASSNWKQKLDWFVDPGPNGYRQELRELGFSPSDAAGMLSGRNGFIRKNFARDNWHLFKDKLSNKQFAGLLSTKNWRLVTQYVLGLEDIKPKTAGHLVKSLRSSKWQELNNISDEQLAQLREAAKQAQQEAASSSPAQDQQ